MSDEKTTHELSARFDPTGIEAPIYQRWLDRNAFHVEAADVAAPYVIAIPPVSYTHLTLPTRCHRCRSRWSPYH